MIFVVLEEVYSIAPDGSERQLVRRSQKPLFAGDRRTAYSFAKSRAAEFDAADYQADAGFPYFSGEMWRSARLTASSSSLRCLHERARRAAHQLGSRRFS
jgi:hypothetical protein